MNIKYSILLLLALGIILIHVDTRAFPNGLLLRHLILILFSTVASYYVYDERKKQREAYANLEKYLKICAWCKTIRVTDPVSKAERWITIEDYMKEEHNFKSSHGMCPTCFAEHSGIYSDTTN